MLSKQLKQCPKISFWLSSKAQELEEDLSQSNMKYSREFHLLLPLFSLDDEANQKKPLTLPVQNMILSKVC